MPAPDRSNRVGLCLDCLHARVVRARGGQDYYRCGRSDDDGRFPKYPRLPMLRCEGYDAGAPLPGRTDPVDASR